MSTQVRSTKPPVRFDLGSRIRYTRRAAVARKHTKIGGSKVEPYWGLHEGWPQRASMLLPVDDAGKNFEDRLQEFDPGESVNKAIYEWDEDGIGTIIGLVKRGVGESTSSRVNVGFEYDDYEPGYFIPKEWRWLYTVRHALYGTDYILVPVENAEPA